MPFEWRDFLGVADWLDEQPIDDVDLAIEDAILRTVIGRAYYAAFHVARSFVNAGIQANTMRWPTSRASIHDKEWAALRTHPDRTVRKLGDKGGALKDRRTEADYSVTPNKSRAAIAREARYVAREIFTGLDAAT